MLSEKNIINGSYNANVSNSLDYNSTPRFRWYGYKEGFSGELVNDALKSVDFKNDDYVLDPFNGNGTVTLTASINNIKSVGIEVNPFVAFMARVKLTNVNAKKFHKEINPLLLSVKKGAKSKLSKYSTFSELTGKSKWLFNSSVLNSFEGGWASTLNFSKEKKELFQLALIGAALDNCNAAKDGKCLKYKPNWREKEFRRETFMNSLESRLNIIVEDLNSSNIPEKAIIINADSRSAVKGIPSKFKLCITSPPYLNSFDYTDIYRPELFLGKFINSSEDLKKLRYETVRSHVEIKLPKPINTEFGDIFNSIYNKISKSNDLWDKQIPLMIQSYFEDLENVLFNLSKKAKTGAQLWLIVANSIYVGIEIPVDLILAEIGTKKGWKLQRIEVLRNIQRRKTKHNGNLNSVRESLIVFCK